MFLTYKILPVKQRARSNSHNHDESVFVDGHMAGVAVNICIEFILWKEDLGRTGDASHVGNYRADRPLQQI